MLVLLNLLLYHTGVYSHVCEIFVCTVNCTSCAHNATGLNLFLPKMYCHRVLSFLQEYTCSAASSNDVLQCGAA